MNTILNFEDVLPLANQAAQAYRALPSTDKTFGCWVLDTFYPDVVAEALPNGRDFCGAQRTTDAKYYLLGLLRRGNLDLTTLQDRFQGAQARV